MMAKNDDQVPFMGLDFFFFSDKLNICRVNQRKEKRA